MTPAEYWLARAGAQFTLSPTGPRDTKYVFVRDVPGTDYVMMRIPGVSVAIRKSRDRLELPSDAFPEEAR